MRKILAGAIAAVCLSPVALRAEVVRFDIVERLPAFAGRSFGDVGPYERITARATIALNPSDDRNAVITDLAQRLADEAALISRRTAIAQRLREGEQRKKDELE